MRSTCTVIMALLFTGGAGAQMFVEDFEGDLSQWTGNFGGSHSGAIVGDPLRPGNHALNFTQPASGGDLFSEVIPQPAAGTIWLIFEYLGLTGDAQGWVGYSHADYSFVTWVAGAHDVQSPGLVLANDGQWHTYAIELSPQYFNLMDFRLVLEDHANPGDAYFDNVVVLSFSELTWFEWPECEGGNGHFYARIEPMLWEQAEAVAVANGGRLASILNCAENSWLVNTFAGFGDNHVWTGLDDSDLDGIWEWTSGEDVFYTNWAPGEPGGSEPFGILYLNGQLSSFWGDHYDVGMPGIIEVGTCELQADLDKDGDVDIADLAALLANYGRVCH